MVNRFGLQKCGFIVYFGNRLLRVALIYGLHSAIAMLASYALVKWRPCEGFGGRLQLTVGKYPRVKTLSSEVLPQAPSPMMTNFLWKRCSNQSRLVGKNYYHCFASVRVRSRPFAFNASNVVKAWLRARICRICCMRDVVGYSIGSIQAPEPTPKTTPRSNEHYKRTYLRITFC